MLWTVIVAACLAVLLPQVTCFPSRLERPDYDYYTDRDGGLMEEPTWRLDFKRELGDELMAEKRALSVLSRWKPFTDTFRTSGRPSRAQMMSGMLPRGLEVVSAETRGTSLRPHGQPLRWGRRR